MRSRIPLSCRQEDHHAAAGLEHGRELRLRYFLSMAPLIPLVVVIVAAALVARFYDLRRLDDPFVTAFLFLSVLWIAGSGLGAVFARFPQPSATTTLLLFAGYAAFVLGGLLRATMAGRSRPAHDDPPARPASREPVVARYWLTLAVGYVLVVVFIVIVGGIPVLAEDGAQARVDARAGLGYLVIAAIWLITLPSVTLVADAYSRGRRWRHASWAVVAVSALALGTFGNRAPVVVLIIASGWVAFFLSRGLPRWPFLAAAGATALLVVAALGVLRGGGAPGLDVVGTLQWQMYVNASNLERLVQLIPEETPHLWGRGYLIDLAVLLPGSQPNFGTWLKEVIGMEFPGGGITIGLFGEFYANWGAPVAVAGSFGVGLAMASIRPWLAIRRPVDVAFAVLLSLAIGGMVQSGVVSVMLYSVIPLSGLYLIALQTGRRRPNAPEESIFPPSDDVRPPLSPGRSSPS